MTPEQRMAGRELDAAVAEKVMGWKRGKRYGNGNGEWDRPDDPAPRKGFESQHKTTWDSTPRYSTEIASAWLVVEKMRSLSYCLAFFSVWDATMWAVYDFPEMQHLADPPHKWPTGYPDFDQATFLAEAETLPFAICLAALKAVESLAPQGETP